MFCSKTSYNRFKQIQRKGVQIVYNEPHMSLDKLLTHDQGTCVHRKHITHAQGTSVHRKHITHAQGTCVHCKHINTLLTEIYKTFSAENTFF